MAEFDPTLEHWPTSDPHELLQFVAGIPDDGQRRLATALAQALIQFQPAVAESAADRADLRAQLEALTERVTELEGGAP